MKNNNQNAIEFLTNLSGQPIPEALGKLSSEDVEEVTEYISNIVEQEDAAYAKLFESLAMMMKYVPNFILHQIIPRYVEPAIAAKITRNLNTKQIVGVASGLSVEYISEASIHMEDKVAAAVLDGLKRKLASQVIEHTIKNHPVYALDILLHSHDRFKKEAKEHFKGFEIDPGTLSATRLETFKAVCVF
ncbi:hypothetical protein [Litoribrevibacter albus]|uniref:Uncharacterized protein n=1 Tax=Litoribrevibacter albus TaxID=1473156 RepID=A0AA37S8Z6_9GAMM|nr:hypothetical protein [Litoribrevibacter albus]GLQ30455.1 hypothetical protein GCM10007876_09330 [Litoribrevibacter albus]